MQIQDNNKIRSEEKILENEIKTRFDATLVVIIIIILITGVAMTGVYFDYW